MPARKTRASTGSWRAPACSSESSLRAEKTGRGLWKIASVRSHHCRSGLASAVRVAICCRAAPETSTLGLLEDEHLLVPRAAPLADELRRQRGPLTDPFERREVVMEGI